MPEPNTFSVLLACRAFRRGGNLSLLSSGSPQFKGLTMTKTLTYRDFGLKVDPFPFITAPVPFTTVGGNGELTFAYWNPKVKLGDRPLEEAIPIAVAIWHFKNPLRDIFSHLGTSIDPWSGATPMEEAEQELRACYYFCYLLGVKFWCWHDFDVVPAGSSMAEFHANIDALLPVIKELSDLTGIKVGWTTQNLFSLPGYTEGAATNPNEDRIAQAWAQTKKMLDVAKWLQDNGCGAKNHVFWGGREGYRELLSTMLGLEQKQLAAFLWAAVRYAQSIGLEVQFLIEPKWCEPSTRQYDSSAEVVIGFLRQWNLLPHFKLNLEVNHAQLAGLPMFHEVEVAVAQDLLGGIDVNEGTYGNGWDTDRFLGDPRIAFEIMYPILRTGGSIGTGVFNFDAHRDRGSFAPVDLFHAHILGMDALALGAMLAQVVIERGDLERAVKTRYAGTGLNVRDTLLASIQDPGALDLSALAAAGMSVPFAIKSEESAHHDRNRSYVLRAYPEALRRLGSA